MVRPGAPQASWQPASMKQILFTCLLIASCCSVTLGSSSTQASIGQHSWADAQLWSRRLQEASVPRVITKQHSDTVSVEDERADSRYTPLRTQPSSGITPSTPSTPTSQAQFIGSIQRSVPGSNGTLAVPYDVAPEVVGADEQLPATNTNDTYPTTNIPTSTTPVTYQSTQQSDPPVVSTAGTPTNLPQSLPVRTQLPGLPSDSSLAAVPDFQTVPGELGSTSIQGNSTQVTVSEDEPKAGRSGQLGNPSARKEVPSGGTDLERRGEEGPVHSTQPNSSHPTVSSEDDSGTGEDETEDAPSSDGWLTLPSAGSGAGAGAKPSSRSGKPSTRLSAPSYKSSNSTGERKYTVPSSPGDGKPQVPQLTDSKDTVITHAPSTVASSATGTLTTPPFRSRTRGSGDTGFSDGEDTIPSDPLPSDPDSSSPTFNEDQRSPSVSNLPSEEDEDGAPHGAPARMGNDDAHPSTAHHTPHFSVEDLLNDVPEEFSRYDSDDRMQDGAEFNDTMLEDSPPESAEDTPSSGVPTDFAGSMSGVDTQVAKTRQGAPELGGSGLFRTDGSSGAVVVDTRDTPRLAGGDVPALKARDGEEEPEDPEEDDPGVGRPSVTQRSSHGSSSRLRDPGSTTDDGDPGESGSEATRTSGPSMPQKNSRSFGAGNDGSLLPVRLTDGDDDQLGDDEISPPPTHSDLEQDPWKMGTPSDSTSAQGSTQDDEPTAKGNNDSQLADDEDDQPTTTTGNGSWGSDGSQGSLGNGGWHQQQQRPSYDGVVGTTHHQDPGESRPVTTRPGPQNPDSTTSLGDQEPTFGGGWKPQAPRPLEEDSTEEHPRVGLPQEDSGADVQLLRGGGQVGLNERTAVDTQGIQEQQPAYSGGDSTGVVHQGADDSVDTHLVISAGDDEDEDDIVDPDQDEDDTEMPSGGSVVAKVWRMLLTLTFSSALLLGAVLLGWKQLQPRLQSLAGFQPVPSPTERDKQLAQRYAHGASRASSRAGTPASAQLPSLKPSPSWDASSWNGWEGVDDDDDQEPAR